MSLITKYRSWVSALYPRLYECLRGVKLPGKHKRDYHLKRKHELGIFGMQTNDQSEPSKRTAG